MLCLVARAVDTDTKSGLCSSLSPPALLAVSDDFSALQKRRQGSFLDHADVHRFQPGSQCPRHQREPCSDPACGIAGDAVARRRPRPDPAAGLGARLQARGRRNHVPGGQTQRRARYRAGTGRDHGSHGPHAPCGFEVGYRPYRPLHWWCLANVRWSGTVRWFRGTPWLRGTPWIRRRPTLRVWRSHDDRVGRAAAEAGGERG